MITKTAIARDVDQYIAGFPPATRELLVQLRATILDTATGAEELISYQMPAYKLNGLLVYFAGYANHIGFYPTPSAVAHFKKELSAFKLAKATVQFPLDKPLPLKLIERMVKFRMKENMLKASLKKVKK